MLQYYLILNNITAQNNNKNLTCILPDYFQLQWHKMIRDTLITHISTKYISSVLDNYASQNINQVSH